MARRRGREGFTLIELLVVVSLIALLLGILMPALSHARASARLAMCLANTQQLGVGVYAHAADRGGVIPSAPSVPYALEPGTTWAQNMSNWIWVMPDPALGLTAPMHNAHGVLLDGYLTNPNAMFCPGTDAPEYYQGELEHYRDLDRDIYSAYLYRQFDQTTGQHIERLGVNRSGQPARALFVDVNRLGPPGEAPATNHGGKVSTVGYVDGHATTVDNQAGWLTAREEDYVSYDVLIDRIAVILEAMDYSEHGDLNQWSP